jgi:hypothetical protein
MGKKRKKLTWVISIKRILSSKLKLTAVFEKNSSLEVFLLVLVCFAVLGV